MPDHPITGTNAATYIQHVGSHGLTEDIAWLLDVGRFPVGCTVLDVGSGTGALAAALADDAQFARSVTGVELSPELADHARQRARGATIVTGDFVAWDPPAGWQPDTIVMSYFLHHCESAERHLERAARLLPNGGRLYVVDRVAVDDPALAAFPSFWRRSYRAAHEWCEDMPQLFPVERLVGAAKSAGFAFVRREVCPHDKRAGAERFPKTLMEFWRQATGCTFPGVMLISPAHRDQFAEIVEALATRGLYVSSANAVVYSEQMIRTIYRRCPWREALVQYVSEKCADRTAIAVNVAGDATSPDLLRRVSLFKKECRGNWTSLVGDMSGDGFRPIIHPFHVPEPYEAEAFAMQCSGASAGQYAP